LYKKMSSSENGEKVKEKSVGFGHVVIGPPGSGKSTYCAGVQQLLNGLGRKSCLVNLDPANDALPYDASVDVCELIDARVAAETYDLGPNGALMFSMEYLLANSDWLVDQLQQARKKGAQYFVFDMPGQLELFTHSNTIKALLEILKEDANLQLAALNLVDAHYCTDASKYISMLLVCLNTMIHLELPHVNVLSKMDLLEQYGELDFGLEYYTDVLDLEYLMQVLEKQPGSKRFHALNEALIELVDDYALIRFHTLDVQDKDSMVSLLKALDTAGGYMYADMDAVQQWTPQKPMSFNETNSSGSKQASSSNDALDPFHDVRIHERMPPT